MELLIKNYGSLLTRIDLKIEILDFYKMISYIGNYSDHHYISFL